MRRRDVALLGLLAAISLGAYLLVSWRLHGLGFPLDDAWIHQTYARNLVVQGEWAYVPGRPSAGSTAPLWSAWLAVGHALGLGPYAWAYLSGWLLLWSLSVLAGRAFGWLAPSSADKAAWVGALFALEWHLTWAAASGMETLLFASMATLAVVLLVRRADYEGERQPANWFGLGALVGASTWVRPEGITLLGPVGLGVALSSGFRSWPSRWRAGMWVLAGFGALFFPYLLFNRSLSGVWWPNTFYAKQAEYAVLRQAPLWLRLGRQWTLPLVGVGALLLPGFVIFVIEAARRRRWGVLSGALWAVGHLSLYAVKLPATYQHGRYAMPAMPTFFLFGAAGLVSWARPASARLWRRLLSRVWLLSSGLILIAFWGLGARAYAQDVAFIESEMVATARWLAENTQEQDLIAAHDIGALGYFSPRPLLDLAGLVSPDVVPFIRDENRLAGYLDEQRADYLVTFPGWYPELARRGLLIYSTEGEFAPALGGENMAVYRWPPP